MCKEKMKKSTIIIITIAALLLYGNIGLLVSGLTPVWSESKTGDRFYVFDNFNLPVLDYDGSQIRQSSRART
jgi:hypothetical protein